MTQQTPLRLPDTMTRDDMGPYMKGVREHFALSQQDVSERLHIRHRYIEAIETGQLDQMPGKAYAKGYVHTYAEFLGLDADQVVEISFGPEPVREQQAHFVPATARSKRGGGNWAAWRSMGILAVVGGVFLLGVVQFFSASDEAPAPAPAVTEVPEEMLSEMRTLLMPTAENIDCFGGDGALGCITDSRAWRQMDALTQPSPYLGAADLVAEATSAAAVDDAADDNDNADVAPEPEPEPEKIVKPAAEEKPAKPKEAARPKEPVKVPAKPDAKTKAKDAAKPKAPPAKEAKPQPKPAPAKPDMPVKPAPKPEAPKPAAPTADSDAEPREE